MMPLQEAPLPKGPATAFTPGLFVRHPEHPEWGRGQVQSALEDRITVTFENVGKTVVNALLVRLEAMSESELDALAAIPKSGEAR